MVDFLPPTHAPPRSVSLRSTGPRVDLCLQERWSGVSGSPKNNNKNKIGGLGIARTNVDEARRLREAAGHWRLASAARALRGWRAAVELRRDLLRTLEEAAARWTAPLAAAAFGAWAAWASGRARRRALGEAAVARWASLTAARALRSWREAVEGSERRAQTLEAAIRRWRSRLLWEVRHCSQTKTDRHGNRPTGKYVAM
jgi:hypothetical protein